MAGIRRRAMRVGWLLAGALAAMQAARADDGLKLHVPSPDWRDQVIYFVMIDRFADGDARNNDQGTGEFDPASGAKFSGGDLRGIAQRLDYIEGLGATALWITPPVLNQWWNPRANYGGYHGYWARDFKAVDPHFGTLEDYRRLSDALHRRGMYLIQDVVVNHTGDYLHYPAPGGAPQVGTDGAGHRGPSQPPFDANDPRDPAQRARGIYHWTPDIADFDDPRQVWTYQLSGLDDMNTENPEVRRALRDSYGYWIREVGVDAFRVDTAFYVPPSYFRDFLYADDAAAPGVLQVARATGRRDFHVFGEGFALDKPFQDAQMRRIDGYMRDAEGALLPGMIHFPLYGSLTEVFARGRPPAELAYRIERTMQVHADPHRMPTFVDNHDVDRFRRHGSEPALKQALLAMLTLPGIPVIYYGTEQGFTDMRAAMFAGGHGAGGRDRFDTRAPLYRFLREAIALRRAHRVFSRGMPRVLAGNPAAPGVLAYAMEPAGCGGVAARACATADGAPALVVFNTADVPALLPALDVGWGAGVALRPLFALGERPRAARTDADGRLTLVLPPRAAYVWARGTAKPVAPVAGRIALEDAPASVEGDFTLSGTAHGTRQLKLVVDGDLAHAREVAVDAQGRWRAAVDTSAMADAGVEHTAVLWDEAGGAVSPPHRFRVTRPWRGLAEATDPAGDDAGPHGRYRYPTDPSWGSHASLDLRRVRVAGAGGALRIEIQTGELLRGWNPPNDFDHVAFTVFVELPGRTGGARAMPLQNAELPDGMRWHVRLRAHGWASGLFSSEGADAGREGTPLTPGPSLAVDAAARTVTFTLPARALGNPATLAGARVHVTTWDYDGGYRPLTAEPGGGTFGGGGADDPKVMDAVTVVVPPR